MSRPRLVPCACGAERVAASPRSPLAVSHVEEVTRDGRTVSREVAHSALACVEHFPGRALAWVETARGGAVTESAGCPDWARGYMREGWVTR